jgi:hypothetical protein
MRMSGTKKKATLTDDQGRTVELDILDGTAGPRVIDVRKLYGTTGYFTYDPGYTSTGSVIENGAVTITDGKITAITPLLADLRGWLGRTRGLANFDQGITSISRYLPVDPSERDAGAANQSFQDFSMLVQRFPESR